MEKGIDEHIFPIRFSDCDPKNRLRVSSFFDFMEETAILDAEAHGMGIWKMVQNGYTSVISRLKLRINYIPRWGEKLHVSTWTKSIYNHKVALRDYSIRDDNGNMIAEATSSWLMVNLQTGHSEDPEQTPFLPTLYPEKVAISENLMLLEPRANPRVVMAKTAAFSDIDMNRHVNNCRYADWVLDALYLDQSMKGKSIRSIQINYLAGIPVGEEIHLVRFDNSNHHAYVFGVNAKDPTRVHFQARIGIAD
ncbi:MAG: thioesterase [Hallerella succinigenes]|uniref:acyl-[acyl-carrier-protein] thioesterase n=1 Tax=Hallerella succinigenes TaxID=1896222 RepID=UPI000D0CD9F6|nr:acyl-ACP thioesterase domain-containing protein [Hallerella succinigenes]MDD6091590.1 thioesterase [Hallerella succinigenes]